MRVVKLMGRNILLLCSFQKNPQSLDLKYEMHRVLLALFFPVSYFGKAGHFNPITADVGRRILYGRYSTS